jgi:Ca2+/Na+ antiporter
VTDTPTERAAESTWTRLRRRKVVQRSVAYVAAAWALLQGLQFLSDTYDWPSTVLRAVTLAVALGLPIASTLAWYHGERGAGRVSGTELVIIALLFLLGGIRSTCPMGSRRSCSTCWRRFQI